VTWVEETGSTNEDLVAAARAGAPAGAVLVADHQTAGRGRLGRTWQAPPGSALLCSILLRPAPGTVLHGAVWAVALAARDAVTQLTGVQPDLKWPNDLLSGGRKLAGVLAEGVAGPDDPSRLAAVVVGLGLNVGWEQPPSEVAAGAITLEELAGHRVDREALLRALLGALAPLLDLWTGAPALLRERYRSALSTLGQAVRVTMTDREVEGEAVDVTADGALVVRVGDDELVVSAGDVVHLRRA
jgi:BirA family transcriptional regulator, biotin operon repressor / biotin---[acetyl-CoA-carboxylase] ligase